MDRMSSQVSRARGFTLGELMVVLAVLGVALVVAVPAMQRLSQSVQVRTEARRLLAAIHLTRNEAIKRNVPVSLCPSPMARTGEAACAGVYADGWIMFSNRNRDRVVDPGDVLIQAFDGLPPGYSLTNRAATRDENQLITYYPDGTAHRNRTLMICSREDPEVSSWSVILNIVGRPRIARDWGDCPTG